MCTSFNPRLHTASFLVAALCLTTAFAKEDAPERTFLWKISSPGNTLYLLGSIHVATDDFYPLAPEIEDAFAKAKNLAVEANVDAEGVQAKMMKIMMDKGTYKDGATLSTKLSKTTLDLLKDWAAKNNMPFANFEPLRPWALSMTVTMLEVQKLGFKPELGIDIHFLHAAKDKKTIVELESLEAQAGMLADFSDDMQDKFLLSSLTDLDDMKEKFKKCADAWKKGDAKTVSDFLLEEGVKKHPELKPLFEKMFDERNVAMTEKMDGYLKGTDSYFVVVGAGHLLGEKGVVSLLQKKGYKAEQVVKAAPAKEK